MGQTDLLKDLVGMIGPEAENGEEQEDDIEVGSDFPYAKDIKEAPVRTRKQKQSGKVEGQSTNSSSKDFFKSKGELSKIVKFNEIELSRVESSPTNEKSMGSTLQILPQNKIHSNEEVQIIDL